MNELKCNSFFFIYDILVIIISTISFKTGKFYKILSGIPNSKYFALVIQF